MPAASGDYCATRVRSGSVAGIGSHPYDGSARLGTNIAGTTAALAWFRTLG